MKQPVDTYCIICEQLVQEADTEEETPMQVYTDAPCVSCKQDIQDGNFLFILISDKSDANRINRLHKTCVVDEQEVMKEYGSFDQFNNQRIVFITESEALERGLIDERITDPDTGIRLDQMEDNNGNKDSIIL